MKKLMLVFMAFVAMLLFLVIPTGAQETDDVLDSNAVMPPPELRSWTPFEKQFQLYVGFDGNAMDTAPRIDILHEDQSWPFYMEKIGDTLYLFIVPPQYSLTVRSTVDGLEDEFPFVVWAGTQRAIYWFSYDHGTLVVDTMQSAPFITTIPLKPLSPDILTLQLQGTGKNAKVIASVLEELGDQVKLVQLDGGYYDKIWGHVTPSVVRRWKLNETTFGTLLALQYTEGSRDSVVKILRKYSGGNYAIH